MNRRPVLVTGAAGKTGRAVIRALVARGETVRGFVRRPGQARSLEASGACEPVVGDLRDPGAMERAAAGARAVYHICPNLHPAEVEIGRAAIEAARAAGLERFVFHSVLHPQIEAMPHHWRKLRVEEALIESGLAFTILQPAAYMQNVLARLDEIADSGRYRVPYPVETRLSLVDLGDIGEAATTALQDDSLRDATVELCGPESLSQTEVAATLGRVLGREVEAEEVPLDAWAREAQASGLGAEARATLTAMFRHYADHGFTGSSRALAAVLDRAPTTFAECARRAAEGRAET